MPMPKPRSMSYDANADVLYIRFGDNGALSTKAVEKDRGDVWRYAADGSLIGITIPDFFDSWLLAPLFI